MVPKSLLSAVHSLESRPRFALRFDVSAAEGNPLNLIDRAIFYIRKSATRVNLGRRKESGKTREAKGTERRRLEGTLELPL